MSTLEILQELLMKDFSLSREQVGSEAALSGLGIDSLDFIDFFFKVEDRFALKLKDDVPAFGTVNDVVQYIDSLILAAQSTPALRPASTE